MFEKKVAMKVLSTNDTAKVTGGTFSIPFTQSRLQKPALRPGGVSLDIEITDD